MSNQLNFIYIVQNYKEIINKELLIIKELLTLQNLLRIIYSQISLMDQQKRLTQAKIYQDVKKKKEHEIQTKCDFDFNTCRKEMYSKVAKLVKQLSSFTQQKQDSQNFIKMWLDYNSCKKTQKLRKYGIYQQTNNPQDFDDLEEFFEKSSLFDEPSLWFWRITDEFIKDIYMTDIFDVLTAMQLTLQGYFQEGNIRNTKKIYFFEYFNLQSCFIQNIKKKFVILFEVVLEIYPSFNEVNEFQGYEYKHVMVFYHFEKYDQNSEQNKYDITKKYLANQSEYHVHKKYNNCINDIDNKKRDAKQIFNRTYGKQMAYEIRDITKDQKISLTGSKVEGQRYAEDIRKQYVYDEEICAWISIQSKKVSQEKVKKYYLNQMSQDFYQEFDISLREGKLDNILDILSLDIKMTEEQRNVVSEYGNLLVLGRSGTGKTTCTMLKLIALQLIFKQKLQGLKKKNVGNFYAQGISETDVDNNIGLKCVFATASPVLANELKHYYTILTNKMGSDNTKENQKDIQLDSDEEEEKFIASLNKYEKFEQMTLQDFPAFLTIRKLIEMIDGSLHNPFFKQYRNKKVKGNDQILRQWHNENNGVLRLKKQMKQQFNLEDESIIFSQDNDENDDNASDFEYKTLNHNQQESKEVTYEVFVQEFWPTLAKEVQSKMIMKKIQGITPGFLWTHIYSYIKGSKNCYFDGSSQACLSLNGYNNLQNFRFTLKQELLKQIYGLYIKYEKWKMENKYYDLMDAVNYILMNIKKSHYNFHKIHYLMVDEVQDLPDNILILLKKVTQFNVVFSGDTAQNIAKGLEFRSNNMNQVFKEYCNSDMRNSVKKHQLTINFRSHNNILQLANSVVNLLELCFPKTIDSLKKEQSKIIGPKPIIIQSQECLFLILNGNDQQKQIRFGGNQVIIVKDQKSKDNIAQILKHALILTIYEAKGLDFDDVILYNFFNDTSDEWSLLSQLIPEETKIHQQNYKKQIQNEKKTNWCEKIFSYKKIDNQYIIKKYKFEQRSLRFEFKEQNILCNELKQLYVAITRARKRLIIYDDNPTNREGIQNIWKYLQLVEIYTQNNIPLELQDTILQTTQEEWQQQGEMMFKNNFYLQAMKCFALSGNDFWQKKANAFYQAEEGTILLAELEIFDKKQNSKEQKLEIQNKKNELFKEASQIFMQILKPKQAAKCLYSAEDYMGALQIYEDQGWIKEAAEAAYQCKLYSKSGDLFLQYKDYIRSLDAYENAQDWEGLFRALSELKNRSDSDLLAYLNKYLPLLFKQFQDKLVIDDKKEEKKKFNIIENNQIDENQEFNDNSDDDDQDDQDDQDDLHQQTLVSEINDSHQIPIIIESQNLYQNEQFKHILEKEKGEQINQISVDNEDDFSIISQVKSIKSKQNKQLNKQNQSESFIVDISQHQSQNDFEHLSNYDLDDYWLKQDSKSIIDSIQSQQGINADFSALSFTQIFSDPSIQLVKTKCNIYIQDEVMQLIIKWISQFSEEFKQLLKQQRNRRSKNEEVENAIDVILDLDQIDIEFIDLVLDVLEQFQLFKLCIFVCNRYKLINKLNRYIVSIAAQYTPILIHPLQVLKSNTFNLNKYKQKGIVASFAIHSVFENINLQLLLQQNQDQLHSQLMMLGYWKKVAYQLKQEESLNIFQTFQDFRNWNNVYFKQIINRLQAQLDNEQDQNKKNQIQGKLLVCQKKQQICFNSNPQDLFYFDYPSDEFEFQFTINSLEHIYTELIKENRSLIKIKLPQFLINTEQLWNSIIIDQPISEELIIQVCSFLNNYKQSYQLHESTLFLITFVKYINENQNSQISLQYQKEYSNKTIILIRDCLQLIINSFRSNNQSQKDEVFLRSILLLHKIRLPKGQLFGNYIQQAIIKRDSIILEKLIKKKGNASEKNYYFIDIDFDFLIAPIDDVCQILQKRFKIELQTLFSLRFKTSQSNIQETQDQRIDNLATVIANRFNNQNQQNLGRYNILWQQIQPKDLKLLLDFESDNSIQDSVNELVSYLMASSYNQQIYPTVKVRLLEIALSYFNQIKQNSIEGHNNIVKGMILMNFAQKNNLSYLLIDQLSKSNSDLKCYQKYLEYLICRKYSIISDASECYFEYYDLIKQKLNIDEMLNDLTYIFVQQLASLKQKLYLPPMLINYFNQINGNLLQQPLYAVDEDQLNFTIVCIIENFNQIFLFSPQQVILIILSYFLNIQNIPVQILQSLQDLNIQQISFICNNVRNDPINKTISYDNQEFVEILVENAMNNQQLQKNYQDCVDEWDNIQIQNNNLKQFVHKISAQWSKRQQSVKFIDLELNVIRDKINGLRKNLLQILYTLKVEIDFHFIYQQLEELHQFEQNAYHNLHKSQNKQALKEIYSKFFEELDNFDKQLNLFKQNQNNKINIQMQQLDIKNKELLRLKWIRQTAGIGHKEIEKKKANIVKRQDFKIIK
ncbi:hypothetical protein pb186bvf_016132 [Paramecium bursaria]